jgi:hypothetical protein
VQHAPGGPVRQRYTPRHVRGHQPPA